MNKILSHKPDCVSVNVKP